jgi:SAM-dependent methyltransferase
MAKSLFRVWTSLPPGLKQRVRRQWYEVLSSWFSAPDFQFMNFGYAGLPGEPPGPALYGSDADNRYPLQLYRKVASAIDWSGLRGLEVGSGRGGGASFVMRTLKPSSLVGLELTASAVRFSQRRYSQPGLSFRCGDAHALPFPDESLDVVLNVESSLLYENVDLFFREVFRVLARGGRFLYADYRNSASTDRLRRKLRDSGLEIQREDDITQNVARALVLDRVHREELIERNVPRLLRGTFREFAGLKQGTPSGTCPFASGKKTYLCFVAEKPLSSRRSSPASAER